MKDRSHNLTAAKNAINKATKEIADIEERRAELSKQRKEIMDDLRGRYGINPKALKAVLAFNKLGEDEQRGFDLSFEVAREAIGQPWQPDMFMIEDEDGNEKAVPDAAAEAKEAAKDG